MTRTPTKHQLRALALLHGADRAGLTPIRVWDLHTLAYFSEVLAPVWDIEPVALRVLKRARGPFFPELQEAVDSLIGAGVITIWDVAYEADGAGGWRLTGSLRIRPTFADPILSAMSRFHEEHAAVAFAEELALAVSALDPELFSSATGEDATYASNEIGLGNVIDYAEWKGLNHSAAAAESFRHLLPLGAPTSPSELLHLYVRHMAVRS